MLASRAGLCPEAAWCAGLSQGGSWGGLSWLVAVDGVPFLGEPFLSLGSTACFVNFDDKEKQFQGHWSPSLFHRASRSSSEVGVSGDGSAERKTG